MGFCAAFANAAVWASSDTAVVLSSATAGAGAAACCANAEIAIKKIRESNKSCGRPNTSSSFQFSLLELPTLNVSSNLASSMASTRGL